MTAEDLLSVDWDATCGQAATARARGFQALHIRAQR